MSGNRFLHRCLSSMLLVMILSRVVFAASPIDSSRYIVGIITSITDGDNVPSDIMHIYDVSSSQVFAITGLADHQSQEADSLFLVGDVVDVKYQPMAGSDSNALISIAQSESDWERSYAITDVRIQLEKSSISLAETTYGFNDSILPLSSTDGLADSLATLDEHLEAYSSIFIRGVGNLALSIVASTEAPPTSEAFAPIEAGELLLTFRHAVSGKEISEATAYIDGDLVEDCSVPIKLPYGEYSLRVEHEGFTADERTLIIDQGRIYETVLMQQSPPPEESSSFIETFVAFLGFNPMAIIICLALLLALIISLAMLRGRRRLTGQMSNHIGSTYQRSELQPGSQQRDQLSVLQPGQPPSSSGSDSALDEPSASGESNEAGEPSEAKGPGETGDDLADHGFPPEWFEMQETAEHDRDQGLDSRVFHEASGAGRLHEGERREPENEKTEQAIGGIKSAITNLGLLQKQIADYATAHLLSPMNDSSPREAAQREQVTSSGDALAHSDGITEQQSKIYKILGAFHVIHKDLTNSEALLRASGWIPEGERHGAEVEVARKPQSSEVQGRAMPQPELDSRAELSSRVASFAQSATSDLPRQAASNRPVIISAKELETQNPKIRSKRIFPSAMNFDIYQGDMIYIVGESGSGKSVLLKILGGYYLDISGTLLFCDQGLDWKSSGELLKQYVGFVPQIDSLYGDTTPVYLLEDYEMILASVDAGMATGFSRTGSVLDGLGLGLVGGANSTNIRDLSGGQRKRLSIAVEMIRGPRILLLDEPDSGLDPRNRDELFKLLHELNNQGMTIILTTHFQERATADRAFTEEIPLFNRDVDVRDRAIRMYRQM